MITKTFDDVMQSDIDGLIRNQVPESRWIDYKEALPGNTDDEKKEFLRDVISFANASGGDLLFGVREARDATGKTTGIPDPAAAVGLSALSNVDAEIRRLEDIITNGVAPRITGVRIKTISGFSDGPVILIRIPRSWTAPHMVSFKTRSPFTTRRSASRIDMDVTELRGAFLAQAAVGERIEAFRRERLELIMTGATGIERRDDPLLVIHMIPIAALDPILSIDISKAGGETISLQPLSASGWDHRYNFDGFMTFAKQPDNALRSYTQLFRSGAIEAVSSGYASTENKTLAVTSIASHTFQLVQRSIAVQRRLGVEPPTSILLTIVNAEGFRFLPLNVWLSDFGNQPIDRRTLLLPEVLISEAPTDAGAVSLLLRPMFDALWQAAGFARCLEYRDSGEWNPNRQ
jgi:hypothetical protein